MGCGGSSEKNKNSPNGSFNGTYTRRPRISVSVGDSVRKLEGEPVVIFIFGGPGSRKGRVVDDLINSYGFGYIRGEDLLLEELPKKMQNIVQLNSVKDIQDFIRDDPSHVTLEWILNLIKGKLEQHKEDVVLVDLVPNLKLNLKNEAMGQECPAALANFEQKYPVSFALNLAIPADKVLNSKRAYCATPDNATRLKESGGQSDEADFSRTQKRAQIFENGVKPYLDYFESSGRLLTVDVACGQPDVIWNGVHEVMCDLKFSPLRNVNTVILFAFDSSEADKVDHTSYMMERLKLQDLVQNPTDTPKSLLRQLCAYLDKHAQSFDSFVVDVSGTSLSNQLSQQNVAKPVMFLEMYEGYLEDFLPGGTTRTRLPGSSPYHSVVTTENIVCLFPKATSISTCQRISTYVADFASF